MKYPARINILYLIIVALFCTHCSMVQAKDKSPREIVIAYYNAICNKQLINAESYLSKDYLKPGAWKSLREIVEHHISEERRTNIKITKEEIDGLIAIVDYEYDNQGKRWYYGKQALIKEKEGWKIKNTW